MIRTRKIMEKCIGNPSPKLKAKISPFTAANGLIELKLKDPASGAEK